MSARLKNVSDHALPVGAREIEVHFIKALTQSTRITSPYSHWLLENALPDLTARHIASLPFESPRVMTHDGRRESNNSSRVYFTTRSEEHTSELQSH